MAAASFSYRSAATHQDSSDDSDSDKECHDWKHATNRHKDKDDDSLEKIPIPPPPTKETNNVPGKRKRNNIWCEVLEDQMMSETLTHCQLKQKPKNYFNRGEESYDYTLKYKNRDDKNDHSDDDDDLMDDSLETKAKSFKRFHTKDSRPHNFKNLYVQLDPTELAAAKKIVNTLNEEKKYLIFRIVKYVGIEKAMKLLEMTEEIEDKGGMMVLSNNRRRTPGGVYLTLLKADKDIKKEALDKIFEGELNSFEMKKKFEEMRKQKKKLRAEKKKERAMLNEMASRENMVAEENTKSENNQNELKQETEQESSMVTDDTMETEEMSEEVPVTAQNVNPADLEDGEIED